METKKTMRQQQMTFEEFLEDMEIIEDVAMATQMPNHQYQVQRVNAADFLGDQDPELTEDDIKIDLVNGQEEGLELNQNNNLHEDNIIIGEQNQNAWESADLSRIERESIELEEALREAEELAHTIAQNRWNEMKIPLRTETLNRFANELTRMFETRSFSLGQIRRRAGAILKVWDPIDIDDQYLDDTQKDQKEAYHSAIQKIIAIQDVKPDAFPQEQRQVWEQARQQAREQARQARGQADQLAQLLTDHQTSEQAQEQTRKQAEEFTEKVQRLTQDAQKFTREAQELIRSAQDQDERTRESLEGQAEELMEQVWVIKDEAEYVRKRAEQFTQQAQAQARVEQLTQQARQLAQLLDETPFEQQVKEQAQQLAEQLAELLAEHPELQQAEHPWLQQAEQLARQLVQQIEEDKKSQEEESFEQRTGMQIPFEDGEEEGFPKNKVFALHEADQWLLEAYASSKNGSIENSLIFNFFNRFMTNRLLVYYMIENGYQTDITEATVINIKNNYTPNVGKLEKVGFKLEKTFFGSPGFKEVYQSANQAAPFLRALYIAEVRHQDEDEDAKTNQQVLEEIVELDENLNEVKTDQQVLEEIVELDEHMNEVKTPQQKIEAVYKAINKVASIEQEYRNCSIFNLIEKRSLKNDLKKALEDMGKPVNELMTLEIHLPGEDKTTVQEYVMGKLQTGKLLGTGSKSGLAIVASSFKLEEMKSQAAMTNYVGGAIGAVTGIFGAVLAVGALYRTFKNFSDMTWGAGIGAALDAANQMISSGYGMGAALTGTMGTYVKASQGAVGSFAGTLGSETAGVVTAGVGVLVGGLSTGVGLYQYGRALNGVRKGKAAQKKFDRLENNQRVLPQINAEQELARKKHFEKNVLKIQERIVERDAITAGCQTVSGICVMAASAMSLASAIPVLGVVGAGLGAAGFLIGVGGTIVSWIKKSRDYEKAVDDFLDLEELAGQRIRDCERKLNKELSRSEEKKIKEQLRREMMEAYGYTSVKAFCAYIMNSYAAHIHNQMEPIWRSRKELKKGQKLEDVLSPEENAYLTLIKSLGLEFKVAESAEKDHLPTQQMIFEKLMR